MASYPLFDGCDISLFAAATMAAHTRVKIDSAGKVAVAAATDVGIGYVGPAGAVSGEICMVRLLGRPQKAITTTAVVTGSKLFATASGKVDDTDPGTARVVGVALNASGAADEVIDFVPCDYIS
jgi:hypothetical protein